WGEKQDRPGQTPGGQPLRTQRRTAGGQGYRIPAPKPAGRGGSLCRRSTGGSGPRQGTAAGIYRLQDKGVERVSPLRKPVGGGQVQPFVLIGGWVERSDTHQFLEAGDGYRFALPILRPMYPGEPLPASGLCAKVRYS